MDHITSRSPMSLAAENARFMSGVYRWMTLGILLTALVSYVVGTDAQLLEIIFSNPFLFYGMMIAEFALVVFISARIQKISAMTATTLYLFYSALTGATLSFIFMAYTRDSITSVFLTTAIAFGGLSAFGYVTKRDLGPVGSFCMMGLWGLIGFAILSFFFPSLMGARMSLVYNMAGLLIFSGLTAWDTQRIKNNYVPGNEGTEMGQKATIIGALTLYLDFINLFLFLLRLMGGRRR